MKNKKAMETFGVIITATIGLIILVVIVGLIKGIIIDKQIAFAGSKTEEITIDCDEDDSIGLADNCPCNPAIQKLEKKDKCGKASSRAAENCPALCKNE
ncbi:MAG: hypothetical protein QF917_00120 [Candidatus Woesearchaeota archaeon]|jgi:hypothetical protein|nr:hypothetical protein [Candidatus Woesearchaeota archaeon]|tara:strand:- start:15303 stop:15599 length:297 start_codon:yes stop_codon:yes gene_type:complete